MKKEKKSKEPYEPKNTPKPPQIIEPNAGRQRENPVEEEDSRTRPSNESSETKASSDKTGKPHLLGDDADIDDETTI